MSGISNVKSPTVGGLTGTACNSFAPVIQTNKSKNSAMIIPSS